MPLNNYDPIELVTTLRTAPLNGAPSSADYNDSMREILTDLATITDTVNQSLLPYINSLPVSSPLTLDGDGMYAGNPADTAPLFLDSTDGSQLTVAQVFTKLNAQIISALATVSDLQARVLQLQTRLATTNQNDVQQAIQGFQTLLQQLTTRLASDEAAIAAIPSVQVYNVVCFHYGKPYAAGVLLLQAFTTQVTFPAQFAGSQGSCGVNPTASAGYTLTQNGLTIGSVTISAAGAFTFATTTNAAVVVNAGDLLSVIAPATQDATLSNVTFTLAGTCVG